ncbi:hypothetical protein BU16DRAFT_250236 [Lophium mytilinum]|uniref:Uncharacterized protein n=1 Tax=Lophium mytilinum TaxID=390894 RepID=A0A6A6R9R5_9PEZI|nr:hypothetical protein BU16DRAFT_250236 [Lophium mytilinum]
MPATNPFAKVVGWWRQRQEKARLVQWALEEKAAAAKTEEVAEWRRWVDANPDRWLSLRWDTVSRAALARLDSVGRFGDTRPVSDSVRRREETQREREELAQRYADMVRREEEQTAERARRAAELEEAVRRREQEEALRAADEVAWEYRELVRSGEEALLRELEADEHKVTISPPGGLEVTISSPGGLAWEYRELVRISEEALLESLSADEPNSPGGLSGRLESVRPVAFDKGSRTAHVREVSERGELPVRMSEDSEW